MPLPVKPCFLSVKAVLLDAQGRCLIIRRSAASKNNAGTWDFPGGKIDPGEAIDVALSREIGEETGLRVEIQNVLGFAESEMSDRRIVYLFFLARRDGGEVRLSAEHTEAKWIRPAELPGVGVSPQFEAFARSLSLRKLD